MSGASRYPTIGGYAVIGDRHSAALVSRHGSIDWCCMRRLDAASVFGRLLDWQRGGSCSLAPVGEYETSRTYVDDTLVLETTFHTATGAARLLDCFAMRDGGPDAPRHQLLRVVEGVRAKVDLHLSILPRFDYGRVKPWLRHHAEHFFSSVGGNDALLDSCDADLEPVDTPDLEATFTVRSGDRARLSIESIRPEQLDPGPPRPPVSTDIDHRLIETLAWWRRWVKEISFDEPDLGAVQRSAMVLKALTDASTGAVAAAVTTALPERIGGTRNWDYCYSWIRDSRFTVGSVGEIGCVTGAEGFRRFVERSAASDSASLQIMYGTGREAADRELLVELAAELWKQPDAGIREMRGEPRHFVESKGMCWVALDRGLRLATECLRPAPERRGRKVREEIRASVEAHGYDKRRGTFVQS